MHTKCLHTQSELRHEIQAAQYHEGAGLVIHFPTCCVFSLISVWVSTSVK